MRIDSVAASPDRAGRFLVKFDSGAVMRLYRQTVEDFGLYPGQELSEEQMERLRENAGAVGAKMRAIRIVSASSVSRRDLEQRQRILKDSHCGAFAVICVCLLVLAQWCLFFSAQKPILLPLAMLPVVTRACAGLAVLSLRPMRTSQYASTGGKTAGARCFLCVLLAAGLLLPLLICGWRGVAGLAACGVYWLAAAYGYRRLDGMSGDISGFALCLAELAGAAVLCL